MSFYTVNYLGELISAPSVYAPEYTLVESEKDTYDYPVDGWYWFESTVEAADSLLQITPQNSVVIAVETIQRHIDEQLKPTAVNTISEVKLAIRTGLLDAVSELQTFIED